MFAWKKQGLLPSSLLALGLALALTALLCLGMTPLFLRELLPLDRAEPCALLAAGLAVFAVVLPVTRARGRQALPTAGIVAGGVVLAGALACALGGKGFAFGPWLIRLAAASAAGGLLGAVMSIRKTTAGRRRRRR